MKPCRNCHHHIILDKNLNPVPADIHGRRHLRFRYHPSRTAYDCVAWYCDNCINGKQPRGVRALPDYMRMPLDTHKQYIKMRWGVERLMPLDWPDERPRKPPKKLNAAEPAPSIPSAQFLNNFMREACYV